MTNIKCSNFFGTNIINECQKKIYNIPPNIKNNFYCINKCYSFSGESSTKTLYDFPKKGDI